MNTLTRTITVVAVVAVVATLLAVTPFSAAQETAPPAEQKKPVEMSDLEKQFERTMSGATMVGRFSTHGKEDEHPPEDRYEISKVTKIGEDLWLFTARFGKAKLPLPIPVPVKWAGDTPVISVTKLTIPTMGTFTARVVIYEGHYAGTWDAGDHGGHMWGRIERPKDAPAEKPKE
jgi:hypothetical protein